MKLRSPPDPELEDFGMDFLSDRVARRQRTFRVLPGCRYGRVGLLERLENELASLNKRVKQFENSNQEGLLLKLQKQREEVRALRLAIQKNKEILQLKEEGEFDKAMAAETNHWRSLCNFELEKLSRSKARAGSQDQSRIEIKLEVCSRAVSRVTMELQTLGRLLADELAENEALKEAFRKQSSRILWKELRRNPSRGLRASLSPLAKLGLGSV